MKWRCQPIFNLQAAAVIGLVFSLFAWILLFSPVRANSLFPGADPDLVANSKQYWIYSTNAGGTPYNCFFAHHSSDLLHWDKTSPILDLSSIKWINDDGAKSHELWAPCVFRRKGKWYLYYSVGPQTPTPSRIGVAVSDRPDGVFIDSGRPLVTGGSGFEAIDPMVFRDPASGKIYLYCGGSAGSTLHVYALNDDLVSIKSQIPVDNPKDFTEGAFMHIYGGKYYLSYSHGNWLNDTYCVCYSTADSPTGPWTYGGKILQTDDHYVGPGHHAFFLNPSNGKWYIAYHRWYRDKSRNVGPDSRIVAIDLMHYDKNGAILPIEMTDDKVTAAPLANSL